jgi:hypothetical protein
MAHITIVVWTVAPNDAERMKKSCLVRQLLGRHRAIPVQLVRIALRIMGIRDQLLLQGEKGTNLAW